MIWLSVLNATLCTVVPVMMVMMAIERIGSGLAAQVGMVGPMSTMVMGVLLLDEPFTAWLVAGTVLVIAGVFVCSRACMKGSRRAAAAFGFLYLRRGPSRPCTRGFRF